MTEQLHFLHFHLTIYMYTDTIIYPNSHRHTMIQTHTIIDTQYYIHTHTVTDTYIYIHTYIHMYIYYTDTHCYIHIVVVQSLSHVQLVCDPKNCSQPGSSKHGIFQARILEQVAFPPQGAITTQETEPTSPALAGGSFTTEPPGKPFYIYTYTIIFIHTHTLLQMYTQLYIFAHCYRYPITDTHAILYIHTTVYTCTLLYTHNYIYTHTLLNNTLTYNIHTLMCIHRHCYIDTHTIYRHIIIYMCVWMCAQSCPTLL